MEIHPALARYTARLPEMKPLAASTVAERRREMAEHLARTAPEPDPAIVVDDRVVDGPDGDPLPVRVYRPAGAAPAAEGDAPAPRPAALWCHGGAFVLGDLGTEDGACRLVCGRLGAVVVAVDYRLAPEHPFPAAIEDCYRGLVWLVDHADERGVDPGRVAVGGHSAGGGLAATLALVARDRGGPALAYQFLGIPMLADRSDTWSMRTHTDARLWNAEQSRAGWDLYLGPDRTEVSPYASPARAADLAGLPPAYVLVHELDPEADDDLEYAARLRRAGVSAEVHVVPGAWHGFHQYLPWLPLSRRTNDRWVEAMGEGLGVPPP